MENGTHPGSDDELRPERPRIASGKQLWRLNDLGLLTLRSDPGETITMREAFGVIERCLSPSS